MSRLNRALAAAIMAVAAAGGGLLSAPAGAAPVGLSVPAASCLPSDGTQPPPVSSGGRDQLLGVTVVSACDVWAVGGSQDADPRSLEQPLIEHWTGGGSWTVVPSPGPGAGRAARLTGVSAVSASDIWAVGKYVDAGDSFPPLILHWDGTSWTRQTITGTTGLDAVTALPTGEAWAVGSGTILHRQGNDWTPASLPPGLDPAELHLTTVTATSASDAWAAGFSVANSPPFSLSSVMLRWDGSSWSRATLPDIPMILNGMTAVTAGNAWAVGRTVGNDGSAAPLTLHWDGTSWTAVPSPDPATGAQPAAQLNAVTASSASSVWAVGSYTTGGDGSGNPPQASLLLHGDGHNWAQVPTPRAGTFDNLFGVAAGPAGTVWTAGSTSSGSGLFRSAAWTFAAVPNVIGDSQAAATGAMSSAGLGVTVTTVPAGGSCGLATNGTIIATTPPAGTITTPPAAMTLCSFPVATVPSLGGLSDPAARSAITSAGLRVGSISLRFNCSIPVGTVLGQSPGGGTQVPSGSAVSLTEDTHQGTSSAAIHPHLCTP